MATQAEIEQKLRPYFPGVQAKILAAIIATDSTQIANLNAWATATATKLNTEFGVANAETALPFAPALAVDYDTDPQA